MSIARIIIDNYKSIKHCDLSLNELNILIGENGSGKTTVLEAIDYFYSNLAYGENYRNDIFNVNNKFSNEVVITLYYDMTKTINIAKSKISDTNEDDDSEAEYEHYYSKIVSFEKDLINDKYLVVTMKQIKNERIIWNLQLKDRYLVQGLFPFFLIKLRDIDIFDWEDIWNIIGELTKESHQSRKEISNSIKDVLNNPETKISNKIHQIESIFEDSNYRINHTTSKDFAILLTKLYFNGDDIRYKDKNTSYFSIGTNSVHYLELLIKLVFRLSKIKLKTPLFMLDEPELNLHQKYIDYLSNLFIETQDAVQYIISTHSPRITKNIIKIQNEVCVYRTKLNQGESEFHKVKLFSIINPKTIYKVTDEHANAYFAKGLLFVEGESELELFSNPFIKVLFPVLNNIDVFKAMSNDVDGDIVIPSRVNTNIPYKILIDMDKVLHYNRNTCAFSTDRFLNKLTNRDKEKYMFYGDEKNTLYSLRKRIDAMIDKCKVHYYPPIYSCNDQNYYLIVSLLKQYLFRYNVLVCRTTIEGVLINEKTKQIALDFLKDKKPLAFSDFFTYYSTLHSTDQLNLLRLVYNGKTDLLIDYKKIDFNNPSIITIIKNVIIGSKTSWISDFVSYYFAKRGVFDYKKINREEEMHVFSNDFQELSNIINSLTYY